MNTLYFPSAGKNETLERMNLYVHIGDNNLHLFENYTHYRKKPEPAKYIFHDPWLFDDEMNTYNQINIFLSANRKIAEHKIAEIEKSDSETECIAFFTSMCTKYY